MLYGRERELLELESRYGSGRFDFLSIYGRKRVGKTALVREFLKGHEGVFFTARNMGSNVDALASAVFGSGVSAPMESILEEIKRRSSSERYVLVIDEYPRIVRWDPVFRDHLRMFIDDIRGDSKLFLILCGSSIGIMEHEMLGYGSHTGLMKLLPLDVWDSMRLLEGFSREDALRIYGMVGGIPLYLNLFDPDFSLVENVLRLFIRKSSFFHNEHLVLFMEEVGGPFTHHGVLWAIASGNIRVGDIAEYCDMETSAVSKHLNMLISMDIVGKRRPVDNPGGKVTRYHIEDPFLRFQFSRILPVVDYIDQDDPYGDVEAILRLFEEDMDSVFADICSEHLARVHDGEIGTWWGMDRNTRTVEGIDVISTVIIGGKRSGWFAECRYGDVPVDLDALNDLRYRMALVGGYQSVHPVIYSVSGFTEAVMKDGNVELYTLDDILDPGGVGCDTDR